MAAAIVASTRVLPPVGGTALSDASLLGNACSRQIRLAPKGCILLSFDGNSSSIGGLKNCDRGGECYNQLVLLKAGSYLNEGSIFTTASDLTAGYCFDLSLLR